MAKKVDITDKLNFEEKPVIIIKGKEIEVNDDASTVLKIMATVDNGAEVTLTDLTKMAEMLFTKQGKKNLDSLRLNIMDYSMVIETAMNLITGDDEETGELESPGTPLWRLGINRCNIFRTIWDTNLFSGIQNNELG